MHVFYSRTLFHVFLLKKCVHLVDDTFSNGDFPRDSIFYSNVCLL